VPAAPAAAAAAAAPAAAAPAANGNWWGTDAPDDKGYVENKAWRNPGDMLNAYRGLEKLVGQKGMILPKDSTDKDGWGKVFDALGRPKSAAEYQLPVPPGADPKLAEKFGAKFHELGLNTDQARGAATFWNEYVTGLVAASNAEFKTKAKAEFDGLVKEKGGEADAWFGIAQGAQAQLGFDKPMLEKLERNIGTKTMMEMFYKIGTAMAEDTAHGDGQNKGPMSVEQARARIKEQDADGEWRKKFSAGDAGVRAEREKLNRIIAGMG